MMVDGKFTINTRKGCNIQWNEILVYLLLLSYILMYFFDTLTLLYDKNWVETWKHQVVLELAYVSVLLSLFIQSVDQWTRYSSWRYAHFCDLNELKRAKLFKSAIIRLKVYLRFLNMLSLNKFWNSLCYLIQLTS